MVGLPDAMAGRFGGGSLRQFWGGFEDGSSLHRSRAVAHGQCSTRERSRGSTVPPRPGWRMAVMYDRARSRREGQIRTKFGESCRRVKCHLWSLTLGG